MTRRKKNVAGGGKESEAGKERKMQEQLPVVRWGQIQADNCWQFEYLGAIFQADGDQLPDIRRRVAMAVQRHGKLRHVWKAHQLHVKLKMRLYMAGICSVMVYGAEAWVLTAEVRRILNGANSKMVAAITKKTIKEEATEETRTYDLVASIRANRLRWLGNILRMDDERLLKKAAQQMFGQRKEGDLLMDAPAANTWQELCKMASDEKEWGAKVRAIKDTVRLTKRKKKKRGEKDDGSSEEEDEGWKGWETKRRRKKLNTTVRCRDGFAMSVQASGEHFCTPRQDHGPYTHVEVATCQHEAQLLPFAESGEAGTAPELYVNVPAAVIRAIVAVHGGIATGQLPELVMAEEEEGHGANEEAEADGIVHAGMAAVAASEAEMEDEASKWAEVVEVEVVEVDEDGYAWAAAAQVPSEDMAEMLTEEESDQEEAEVAAETEFDSSEGITMGSPASPYMVIHRGAIPPPPPLLDATLSPITAAPSEEDSDPEPRFVANCDRDIDRCAHIVYSEWARRNPGRAQSQRSAPPHPRNYTSVLTPDGKIRIIPNKT